MRIGCNSQSAASTIKSAALRSISGVRSEIEARCHCRSTFKQYNTRQMFRYISWMYIGNWQIDRHAFTMDDEGTYYYLLLLMKKRPIIWDISIVGGIGCTWNALGIYHTFIQEMRLHSDRHTRYLQMNPEGFDFISEQISPLIQGKDGNMRKCLEPGLKLAVMLHHLAERVSHWCIADHCRLGRSTVSNIIQQTCDVLWQTLQPVYLKPPTGPRDWNDIAEA